MLTHVIYKVKTDNVAVIKKDICGGNIILKWKDQRISMNEKISMGIYRENSIRKDVMLAS